MSKKQKGKKSERQINLLNTKKNIDSERMKLERQSDVIQCQCCHDFSSQKHMLHLLFGQKPGKTYHANAYLDLNIPFDELGPNGEIPEQYTSIIIEDNIMNNPKDGLKVAYCPACGTEFALNAIRLDALEFASEVLEGVFNQVKFFANDDEKPIVADIYSNLYAALKFIRRTYPRVMNKIRTKNDEAYKQPTKLNTQYNYMHNGIGKSALSYQPVNQFITQHKQYKTEQHKKDKDSGIKSYQELTQYRK